jgi:hypothetical protein
MSSLLTNRADISTFIAVVAFTATVILYKSLQTSGPQFFQENQMVKIRPALTCLSGLAEGWLYVKGLEMWFQQGFLAAILRKNGSVTSPRNTAVA